MEAEEDEGELDVLELERRDIGTSSYSPVDADVVENLSTRFALYGSYLGRGRWVDLV